MLPVPSTPQAWLQQRVGYAMSPFASATACGMAWPCKDARTKQVCVSLPLLCKQVLPVYTYDPRFFAVSKYGMPKMGAHRAAFVQAGVEELKQALQRLNSNLLVASGKAEDVIKGGAPMGLVWVVLSVKRWCTAVGMPALVGCALMQLALDMLSVHVRGPCGFHAFL